MRVLAKMFNDRSRILWLQRTGFSHGHWRTTCLLHLFVRCSKHEHHLKHWNLGISTWELSCFGRISAEAAGMCPKLDTVGYQYSLNLWGTGIWQSSAPNFRADSTYLYQTRYNCILVGGDKSLLHLYYWVLTSEVKYMLLVSSFSIVTNTIS